MPVVLYGRKVITASDILHLDFSPDLTEAGIAFACHSLPHTYDRAGASSYDRLRRTVAGASVELAFRRYLVQQEIGFEIKGAAPFTDPDHYDISLGGHRCRIHSFLISHRNQIAALRSNLELALKAPALVPVDRFSADGQSPEDIYLFAFLTGLIAASPEDVRKAYEARLPVHLIYAMPSTWRRPRVWTPLWPLVLKSEADQALGIEIGGQDVGRRPLTRTAELRPQTRFKMEAEFYSLTYLHVKSKPRGRLGIHSPSRAETLTIEPREWNNIWIYGMDIYLAGWMPRDEFRQRARLILEGRRVFQYDHTRTKNLAVPVAELKPLSALLERTRAWQGGRGQNRVARS